MISKEFFIAGVQHHLLHTVLNSLKVGTDLDLVPEPTNKFDPNAIRIEFKAIMLGYVPKKFSSEISAALEIAQEYSCRITHLDPAAKPWEMCKVKVEISSEEGELT